MKIYALIWLWLLPSLAYAQFSATDDLILDVPAPLITRIGSIDELYNPRPIHNAFTLRLKSQGRTRNISAHIIFTGTPGMSLPENWLCLKLINTTSYDAITHENVTPLSGSPALLFTQPATTNGNRKYNSFHYSIVFNPITTFIKTGTYNYSIILTMTEP